MDTNANVSAIRHVTSDATTDAKITHTNATTNAPCEARQPAGGGPRVVVSTAAFHARVRGSVPGLGGLKETKMFLPTQYCGEPS